MATATERVAVVVYTPGVATTGTLEARDLSGASGDAPKLQLRPKFGQKSEDAGLSKSLRPEDPQPADGRQRIKGKRGPVREEQ
jgi:hypothetical protein